MEHAEHAINFFARHRKDVDGRFTAWVIGFSVCHVERPGFLEGRTLDYHVDGVKAWIL